MDLTINVPHYIKFFNINVSLFPFFYNTLLLIFYYRKSIDERPSHIHGLPTSIYIKKSVIDLWSIGHPIQSELEKPQICMSLSTWA